MHIILYLPMHFCKRNMNVNSMNTVLILMLCVTHIIVVYLNMCREIIYDSIEAIVYVLVDV